MKRIETSKSAARCGHKRNRRRAGCAGIPSPKKRVGKMMIELRHEHEIDTADRQRKLVRGRALEFDHPGHGFSPRLIGYILGRIEPNGSREPNSAANISEKRPVSTTSEIALRPTCAASRSRQRRCLAGVSARASS
jgi:hypothetical protein